MKYIKNLMAKIWLHELMWMPFFELKSGFRPKGGMYSKFSWAKKVAIPGGLIPPQGFNNLGSNIFGRLTASKCHQLGVQQLIVGRH
jgi:hypothetical protein